jgi:hypothetical protein
MLSKSALLDWECSSIHMLDAGWVSYPYVSMEHWKHKHVLNAAAGLMSRLELPQHANGDEQAYWNLSSNGTVGVASALLPTGYMYISIYTVLHMPAPTHKNATASLCSCTLLPDRAPYLSSTEHMPFHTLPQ